MAIPGTPGASVPPGEDWLVRKVADLERRLNELAAADPLRTAGIEVTGPDAVRVKGSLNTTGALDVDGPINVDGTMTVGGNATFNGAMAIAGTLSLPAGIIDNEALAAPVAVGRVSVSEIGFATATSDEDRAAGNIPVPAGYSQALVFVTVTAGHTNSTGSPDFMYLSVGINAATSREVFAPAQPGFSTNATTARSALLTGLSGGSINVRCRIHTQGSSWLGGSGSRAYTEAIAVFLR